MENVQELSPKDYVVWVAEGETVLVGEVLEAVSDAPQHNLAAVDALAREAYILALLLLLLHHMLLLWQELCEAPQLQ